MLASSPMNGFVPTRDARKARSFYEGILGLPFEYENQFVTVFRGKDTMIIAQKVEEFSPAPYTILGWEVEDIKKVVSLLSQKGVVFEKYAWMVQDELWIWESPAGKVAWFKDPDGNTLSVSEHGKNAR